MSFVEVEPTLENYWRAIILFGKNTASYKFALAKSLIDVSLERQSDLITLEDLALPYAMHLCEHLNTVQNNPLSRVVNSLTPAWSSITVVSAKIDLSISQQRRALNMYLMPFTLLIPKLLMSGFLILSMKSFY